VTTRCKKILSDIGKNCNTLTPGLQDTIYLINIADIDKDLSSFSDGFTLTDISLIQNSKAYKVEGVNYSKSHKTTAVKKRFSSLWNHELLFRIFDNTPEDKLWINNSLDSKFIVIQENIYNKSGETVFEVLGWEFGLEIITAERESNNDEFPGWLIGAESHDKVKEVKPPIILLVNNSLADTRQFIFDHLYNVDTQKPYYITITLTNANTIEIVYNEDLNESIIPDLIDYIFNPQTVITSDNSTIKSDSTLILSDNG
jgi:hypothetical protein